MRFHPTRKAVLAGLAIAAAGGTAAVAVPAIAAHFPSTPSASAPASTDGSAVTASGARAVARPHLIGLLLRATLKETGLDRATLLQRLGAGETIDQIAGSKAQSVENDALSLLQTRLDRAVSRGRITKDQETTLLATAKSRLDALMTKNLKMLHGNKHDRASSPATSGAA